MTNSVTITGNLGQDPELRFTSGGAAVCTISVGDTPRRKNDQGQWEDAGDTLWLRCTIWREKAEAVAEQLKRGDAVTVIGRLKQRSWEDKDGGKRTVIECDAFDVAKVVKAPPAQREQYAGQGADDPWAAQVNQGRAQAAPQGGSGWGAPANNEPPFAFPPVEVVS